MKLFSQKLFHASIRIFFMLVKRLDFMKECFVCIVFADSKIKGGNDC